MRRFIERFTKDKSGAVSVDWIVLTAGVVALGAGAASMVVDGSGDTATSISDRLGEMLAQPDDASTDSDS
ncbi:MAG: hypothetical protein AAFO58_07465 [Pseudomonadota bacterium]